MQKKNHTFHLVKRSKWPIILSTSLFFFFFSLIIFLHYNFFRKIFFLFFILSVIILNFWFRDVLRESSTLKEYSLPIEKSLRWGFLLFIISEICFFFSFFWGFFHSSVSPSFQVGCEWPPLGVQAINPTGLPLWNTIILLSSGVTVSWTYDNISLKNFLEAKNSLILTIILGLIFTFFQIFEYYNSPFSINDGVYGSTFFIATGFHGFHVIVGTVFLMVSYLNINKKNKILTGCNKITNLWAKEKKFFITKEISKQKKYFIFEEFLWVRMVKKTVLSPEWESLTLPKWKLPIIKKGIWKESEVSNWEFDDLCYFFNLLIKIFETKKLKILSQQEENFGSVKILKINNNNILNYNLENDWKIFFLSL